MKNGKNQINIEEILDRWAGDIYPSRDLFIKAFKNKKLVFYHGVDPTSPHLHLGHSTNYLLLKKLQEAGHKVILLIGDFTAQIGDPTGKSSTRKPLTKKEVLNNCKKYKEQAGKILNFKSLKNPVQVRFNSKWLAKLKLEDVVRLFGHFTNGQMIKRNMFQERISKNQEIYLHEFLYPILQGYDSVALNVDAEVGGNDQTFNMLVGRKLLEIYKQKEKFVITTPLLENPKTGKKLMSKSEGNYIALSDSAKEMYGKTMAMPDEVIIPCFKMCTEVPVLEIKEMESKLNNKTVNPRDLKAKLAKEITKIYHGEKSADNAEKEFEKVFKVGELPEKIEEIEINPPSGGQKMQILDLLVKLGLASSRGEAKRLIIQKGIKKNGEIVNDWQEQVEIKKGEVYQVGKRKFAKII